MSDEFPTNVKQFVDQNIESLPQLEALLLIRQDPQRRWSAEDIASSLYVPVELARTLLSDFVRRGFVTTADSAEGRHSYAVTDAQVDEMLAEVALIYRERRVAVISLIYSKPLNKVQTFAEAFRLRKESPP